jgi:ABC-type lipoprotein release transport system permease subunit
VNTLDARVVAVAADLGFMTSWTVFVPSDDVRELYDVAEGTTGALWIYLQDIDDAPAVMARLRTLFEAKGYRLMEHQAAPYFMKFESTNGEDWTGQKLDLTIWKDEVSFLTWVLTGFQTLTAFLMLVLVAIVGVGIMNTMGNAVRDRTGELGTLRAIGMRRSRVLLLILFEAMLLGLSAGALGALVGVLLSMAISARHVQLGADALRSILFSDELRLALEPAIVVQGVALVVGLTVLASFLPARRAAHLPPITAMQHTE